MPESKFLQKHHKREASAWRVMHRRCLEPKFRDFARYGGSGITICPQWLHQWQNFIQDMGPAPTELHWLGRLDVLKGYSPENCIWTLQAPQERRRAFCKRVVIAGQTMTAAEAGRLPDQPTRNSVLRRMHAGFSLEGPPLAKIYKKSQWVTWEGETLPLPEWARRLGLPHSILWARLKRGMPLEGVMHPARLNKPFLKHQEQQHETSKT